MATRGKFQCVSEKRVYGNKDLRVYEFYAVCSEGSRENELYHKFTPSGTISISVDNPNVVIEPGKFYYVDFTEAQ